MAEAPLSDLYEQQLVKYLAYQRAKRAQCIKDVEAEMNEVRETRLQEDAFSLQEVKDIMNNLSSILLLRQVFSQAEKAKLAIKCDTSVLDDMRLLEEIEQFEKRHFSGKKVCAGCVDGEYQDDVASGFHAAKIEVAPARQKNLLEPVPKQMESMTATSQQTPMYGYTSSAPSTNTARQTAVNSHAEVGSKQQSESSSSVKASTIVSKQTESSSSSNTVPKRDTMTAQPQGSMSMVDDEEAPVPSPVVIYKSVTDPTANAQIDALNKQVEMLTKQLDDLTKNQQLQSGTAQQAYGGDNAKDISEIKTENARLNKQVKDLNTRLEDAEATLSKRVDSSVQFQNVQKMLQNKTEQVKKLRTLCQKFVPEDEITKLF